jgi:hypothetical protein
MKRVTRRKKRKPLPSTTLSHRHCKNQNRRKLASSIDSDGDQIKIIDRLRSDPQSTPNQYHRVARDEPQASNRSARGVCETGHY